MQPETAQLLSLQFRPAATPDANDSIGRTCAAGAGLFQGHVPVPYTWALAIPGSRRWRRPAGYAGRGWPSSWRRSARGEGEFVGDEVGLEWLTNTCGSLQSGMTISVCRTSRLNTHPALLVQ